jgi:hypothetical protein
MDEYDMRRCDFHVPRCITSLFMRSVISVGISLYNMMPTKIKQLESFRDFKQRCKLFLLDHPFYSLNGFFLYLKTITEPLINNTSKTR